MSQIGHNRRTPLLDQVDEPADLRKLDESQLRQFADELRQEMIDVVSETGGHLGAGLGVVELTTAIHYLFDTPRDKLIWDVSHQSYPHKIIHPGQSELCRAAGRRRRAVRGHGADRSCLRTA